MGCVAPGVPVIDAVSSCKIVTFISGFKLLKVLKCAFFSMICRSSIVEVVTTLKYIKLSHLLQVDSGLNLQHQPLCMSLELLFIYISSRLGTRFCIPRRVHSFSILSDDRSKASSKTIPPHSAI